MRTWALFFSKFCKNGLKNTMSYSRLPTSYARYSDRTPRRRIFWIAPVRLIPLFVCDLRGHSPYAAPLSVSFSPRRVCSNTLQYNSCIETYFGLSVTVVYILCFYKIYPLGVHPRSLILFYIKTCYINPDNTS